MAINTSQKVTKTINGNFSNGRYLYLIFNILIEQYDRHNLKFYSKLILNYANRKREIIVPTPFNKALPVGSSEI